jgi:hypothetical protein
MLFLFVTFRELLEAAQSVAALDDGLRVLWQKEYAVV